MSLNVFERQHGVYDEDTKGLWCQCNVTKRVHFYMMR
jgi:hypothetical protein